MTTVEKVWAFALTAAFVFLAYVMHLAILQVEDERRHSPAMRAPATMVAPTKTQMTTAPDMAESGDSAKQLFSRGRLKASTGDCAGAVADFDKAVSMDRTFKDQVPAELDACGKK